MSYERLAFEALKFATEVHAWQKRKYTNEPYIVHLTQVAGIVASVDQQPESIATALLHDCREDCGIPGEQIEKMFGMRVAVGVALLSDFESGNRRERKLAAQARLQSAPGWVQTIKCADIISNAPSIIQHDPKFASVFVRECANMLCVLKDADRGVWGLAKSALPGGLTASVTK